MQTLSKDKHAVIFAKSLEKLYPDGSVSLLSTFERTCILILEVSIRFL